MNHIRTLVTVEIGGKLRKRAQIAHGARSFIIRQDGDCCPTCGQRFNLSGQAINS